MRQRRWRLVVGGLVVAVAAMGAWWGTLDRDAWRAQSPRYAAVDRGCVVVLSSVWDWAPAGGWEFDPCVLILPKWTPRVVKLGTRHSTGGSGWTAPMWGVYVPLWVVGAGAGAVAAFGLWGRPSAGWCRGCGYSLEGIGGVCPECGRGA